MSYGMKSFLKMQPQVTFGTPITDGSGASIAITEESINQNIEQLIENNMYNRFNESPYHEGGHSVVGGITIDANPSAVGTFLNAVMGLCVTTSDTNIQNHVFDVATADFSDRSALEPQNIEIFRDVSSSILYYDMNASDASLSIANGQLLNLTTNFLGAGVVRINPATSVAYVSKAPFIWDQTSLSYNGWAFVDARNLTLNINNNLEAVWTLTGSKAPYRIKRNGFQTVELSGTVLYQSSSLQRGFESQAESQFIMNFAANATDTLKIDIPKLRFKTFEANAAGAGLIEASFTAQGIYSVDSSYSLRITLTNTTNTAY